MSKRKNKTIKLFFAVLYLLIFTVLYTFCDFYSLVNPRSFKDISYWAGSVSFIIPKSNLFNFSYYLLFVLIEPFFENLDILLKKSNFVVYIISFLFYLFYCNKRFKNIFTVFFASLFYLGIYFLLPGANFWVFCSNFLLLLIVPQAAFLLVPLLLLNSFVLGALGSLIFLAYLFLIKKDKVPFLVKLSLVTYTFVCTYILALDYFFYGLSVLKSQDINFLIWQGGLLISILLVTQMFFYLSHNFRGHKLFLIVLVSISFLVGFKTLTPSALIRPLKYSDIDFATFLDKYDLKEENILLLDTGKESLSFFVHSGVDVKNYIFYDDLTDNKNIFEKFLISDRISYVIAENKEILSFFEKEVRENSNLDKFVCRPVYESAYDIWQISTSHNSNVLSGENVFQDYKYLPRNLRLGAESMHKKINSNPYDYMAYTSLGRIYRDLLNFEKAKKHLRQAIALKDDYADAYLHLANTYTIQYSLSKKNSYFLYFMAKQLYLRGLCFDKQNHEYYHLLGDLEEAKGNLKEAVKYSKESLRLSNDICDPSHYRLALWEKERGNIENAKQHLLKAIKYAPSHSGDTPDKYKDLLKTLD